jgi:murein DD-endopeptidase MepM/ murein hydrolase activator NlpD
VKQEHWFALGALGVLAFVAVNRPALEVVIPGAKVKTPQPLAPIYSSRVVYPLEDLGANRLLVPFLAHASLGNYRRGYGWHTGADWQGRNASRGRGSSVLSIADGVVVNSAATISLRGFGNLVVVYHPALRVWTRYAHLERRFVAEGQIVKAGQIVGSMGMSGTDNVHLHFDVLKEKPSGWRMWPGENRAVVERVFVDPVAYLHARGATESGVSA